LAAPRFNALQEISMFKSLALAAALVCGAVNLPALAQVAPALPPAFETVSSETFVSSRPDTLLIDVREPAEWEQTGAPVGAKLISNSRGDFVDAVLEAVGGDKTRPVAVICRSGNRSVRAAERLASAGFTRVTNIGDGMSGRDGVGPGWLGANLPLTRTVSAQ
jgi:rhodanese-related sulfurtransferase